MGVELDPGQSKMMKNGDFEAGWDWWLGTSGTTISGGKARYSADYWADLRTYPYYLELTEQSYRVKIDIDSISNAKVLVGMGGVYTPWYTTPGTKTAVLTPTTPGTAALAIYFRQLNGAAAAVIDNVRVDRIGELTALGYNLLPDPDGKFEAFPASEGRTWGRNASYKDKSRILFLYDPEKD